MCLNKKNKDFSIIKKTGLVFLYNNSEKKDAIEYDAKVA
jgi:hypothetical protein